MREDDAWIVNPAGMGIAAEYRIRGSLPSFSPCAGMPKLDLPPRRVLTVEVFSGCATIPAMSNLTLNLPAEALAGVRIPPRELHDELRRRLAAALYADGILSGASACLMAGMGKAEFQYMLGTRGIAQPLGEADYDQDLANLSAWRAQ